MTEQVCPRCDGNGRIEMLEHCPRCGGSGRIEDEESDLAAFGLVLKFDTDDPRFVRGVEAGRLWEMFRTNEDAFEQEIHAINAEMALRMGEATNRAVQASEIDETWMLLRVSARGVPCA